MQDIHQKIAEIKTFANEQPLSAITIDLMMDKTRELYALLMQKKTNAFTHQPQPAKTTTPPASAPTTTTPTEATYSPIHLSPLTASLLKPRKDIRAMIGINDKYQIITELFQNNNHKYEEAINTLNELEDMDEATLWMDNTIKAYYQWPEHDETLKLFLETLHNFYLKHS